MQIGNYEPVSKDAAAYVKGLMAIWEKLGKPEDCSVNTGWVMLDNIMQVWDKGFPGEKDAWIRNLKEELLVERTVKEALKENGGYFPMSYPTRLYQLIRALLPKQKLNDGEFIHQMVQRYPFLKSTNYKI